MDSTESLPGTSMLGYQMDQPHTQVAHRHLNPSRTSTDPTSHHVPAVASPYLFDQSTIGSVDQCADGTKVGYPWKAHLIQQKTGRQVPHVCPLAWHQVCVYPLPFLTMWKPGVSSNTAS